MENIFGETISLHSFKFTLFGNSKAFETYYDFMNVQHEIWSFTSTLEIEWVGNTSNFSAVQIFDFFLEITSKHTCESSLASLASLAAFVRSSEAFLTA